MKYQGTIDIEGYEAKLYKAGACKILVGKEPHGNNQRLLWHISISHPSRYPTWEEIKRARYELTPKDIEMVMHLPKPENYVNIHENCFHLWELE